MSCNHKFSAIIKQTQSTPIAPEHKETPQVSAASQEHFKGIWGIYLYKVQAQKGLSWCLCASLLLKIALNSRSVIRRNRFWRGLLNHGVEGMKQTWASLSKAGCHSGTEFLSPWSGAESLLILINGFIKALKPLFGSSFPPRVVPVRIQAPKSLLWVPATPQLRHIESPVPSANRSIQADTTIKNLTYPPWSSMEHS